MSKQLRPYYYISGSNVYNGGYPNTSSAMYSGYSNWIIATQFKNTTNKPIKIDFVELSIGMYREPAKGVLVYSDLSSISQVSTKTSIVSDQFTVSTRSALSPIKYFLNKPIVIPSGKIFAFGFKVNTDNSGEYLSIARTNTDKTKKSNAKSVYYAQNLTSALNKSDTISILSANDVWSYQVPYINIYYSDYEEVPKVSKTKLSLIQGLSDSITITGVDSWTYSIDTDYITVVKTDDSKLKVTANYIGTENTTTKLTIKSNTNGKIVITVICKPPTITSITFSKTTIRPTQSSNITALYSDGSIGDIVYIDSGGSSPEFEIEDGQTKQGVKLDKNILSILPITTSDLPTSDWRNSSSDIIHLDYMEVRHPINTNIEEGKFISSMPIYIKHWSKSNIIVSFSNNTIYTGKSISYLDSSSIPGGNDLIAASPLEVTETNHLISCASETSEDKSTIEIHITNDWPVSISKTLTIKTTTPLTMVYPITSQIYGDDCKSYLPLFISYIGGNYICNPYKFPLFITIPSDLPDSGDITLDLSFLYSKNGVAFTPIQEISGISLASLTTSTSLIRGTTEMIVLNLPEINLSLPHPQWGPIQFSLVKEFLLQVDCTYASTDPNPSILPVFEIHFKPFVDYNYPNHENFLHWYPDEFLYNRHNNGHNNSPIQGQNIEYNPFGELINSLYYSASGFAPVKLIMMNYGLFGTNCIICEDLPSEDFQENVYYIVANGDTQSVYYNDETNPIGDDLTPIIEGDYIGSKHSIDVFEYFANCINNFIYLINQKSKTSFPGSPLKIISNQYYMWDDNVDVLADGRNNEFKDFLNGDVNNDGVFNLEDAELILRFAVGLEEPTPEARRRADFDQDNKISAEDARFALLATNVNAPRPTTASPWKYMFKTIYAFQRDTDFNVKYRKNSNDVYDIKFKIDGTTEYNIKYRG